MLFRKSRNYVHEQNFDRAGQTVKVDKTESYLDKIRCFQGFFEGFQTFNLEKNQNTTDKIKTDEKLGS